MPRQTLIFGPPFDKACLVSCLRAHGEQKVPSHTRGKLGLCVR